MLKVHAGSLAVLGFEPRTFTIKSSLIKCLHFILGLIFQTIGRDLTVNHLYEYLHKTLSKIVQEDEVNQVEVYIARKFAHTPEDE